MKSFGFAQDKLGSVSRSFGTQTSAGIKDGVPVVSFERREAWDVIRRAYIHGSAKGGNMKIALSVILPGIVLVGCAAVPRHQTGSGLPPTTESAQSKTPQTQPEVITVEPKEADAVFPHIKPTTVHRAGNLEWIEAYCRQRGIRRLDRDRVRLFVQPMGVVAEAIEVDLANGQLTVYPGTHSKKKTVQRQLDEEQTAKVRALVTSDEFENIPRENKKWGFDGGSYLVEVLIDNLYSWKLHWSPDDKELIKVVEQIQALSRKQGN